MFVLELLFLTINMGKDILGFQMNVEGDKRDIYHIVEGRKTLVDKLRVINIWEPIPIVLPKASHVILTGSTLTIGEPMSEELKSRSDEAVNNVLKLMKKDIPTLGICYGAQIIADKLWPNSVQHTGQWNVGRTKFIPTKSCSIFGDRLEEMAITVSYKAKLIEIPTDNIIAKDKDGGILAFKFGSFVGILGHPEIPLEIIKSVIDQRNGDPRYSNINVLTLTTEEELTLPSSERLIQNFLQS